MLFAGNPVPAEAGIGKLLIATAEQGENDYAKSEQGQLGYLPAAQFIRQPYVQDKRVNHPKGNGIDLPRIITPIRLSGGQVSAADMFGPDKTDDNGKRKYRKT